MRFFISSTSHSAFIWNSWPFALVLFQYLPVLPPNKISKKPKKKKMNFYTEVSTDVYLHYLQCTHGVLGIKLWPSSQWHDGWKSFDYSAFFANSKMWIHSTLEWFAEFSLAIFGRFSHLPSPEQWTVDDSHENAFYCAQLTMCVCMATASVCRLRAEGFFSSSSYLDVLFSTFPFTALKWQLKEKNVKLKPKRFKSHSCTRSVWCVCVCAEIGVLWLRLLPYPPCCTYDFDAKPNRLEQNTRIFRPKDSNHFHFHKSKIKYTNS